MATHSRGRLGSIALMLMTFSAVFAFPSIVNNNTQIGPATTPGHLLDSILYFLPFVLVTAEFAPANSENESGAHSWSGSVLEPKWTFLGAWSYSFVNLFFFCSLLPNALIYGSYTLLGQNAFQGNHNIKIIAVISILLFWLMIWVCVKGASWISKVTSLAGGAYLLMGVAFVVLVFVAVSGLGNEPAQESTTTSIMPTFNWTFFTMMARTLQAVGDGESIGVYIKDAKGGNKTLVYAMIGATIAVGIMYILGAVAVGLVMPTDVLKGNFSNGIFDIFKILGMYFHIPAAVMVRLVGITLFVGSFGSLALWTVAPVRVFSSEIPDRVFGKWLAKTDEEGNPANALLVQGIIMTILVTIPALGIRNMDSFLETLVNMTVSTSLASALFLLVVYIGFRWKKETTPRSFRFGNRTFGLIVGIFLLAIFIFVFFMSTVPDPKLIMEEINGTLPRGTAGPPGMLAYNIIGLIVFMGSAWIRWRRYETKEKDEVGKGEMDYGDLGKL